MKKYEVGDVVFTGTGHEAVVIRVIPSDRDDGLGDTVIVEKKVQEIYLSKNLHDEMPDYDTRKEGSIDHLVDLVDELKAQIMYMYPDGSEEEYDD